MSGPLFSILTVVRDDLPGLLETRASLRAQTFADAEWIVVDGASTDGTADWLAAHAAEPSWWRSAPDRGLYDAMNVALDKARGRFVLFLNAGDRLAAPDTLERLAEATGVPEPDLLYGDALERLPDGRTALKPARSHRFAFYGMPTHHQAIAYRRAAVAGLRFDPRFPIGADYAFTLQALGTARHVRRLDFPVCLFAPGGVSQREAALGRRDQTSIRRELLGHGPLRCAAVSGVQATSALLRRHIPGLYAKCRFRTLETTCRFAPEAAKNR